MAVFNESQINTLAHHDAMRGVYQPEERIDSILGPEPVFDPVNHTEHAKHVRAINQRHVLAEMREHAKGKWESARAKASEPVVWLITKGLLGFVVEALAGILTMYSAGVPFPEDFLFGLALAGLVFALVKFTREGRGVVRYAALGALIVVAIVITAVRLDEVGVAEGASPIVGFALPVLLLLGTFGIALIAEPAIRKLGQIYPEWKKAYEASTDLARAETADKEAQKFLDGLSRDREQWKDVRIKSIALYKSTHRTVTAEINGTNPANGPA